MVLDERSLVEYAVNAGFPQGSIFGPTCFLLYLIDLPDDFLCNFVTMLTILLSTPSLIRHLICGDN